MRTGARKRLFDPPTILRGCHFLSRKQSLDVGVNMCNMLSITLKAFFHKKQWYMAFVWSKVLIAYDIIVVTAVKENRNAIMKFRRQFTLSEMKYELLKDLSQKYDNY